MARGVEGVVGRAEVVVRGARHVKNERKKNVNETFTFSDKTFGTDNESYFCVQ